MKSSLNRGMGWFCAWTPDGSPVPSLPAVSPRFSENAVNLKSSEHFCPACV